MAIQRKYLVYTEEIEKESSKEIFPTYGHTEGSFLYSSVKFMLDLGEWAREPPRIRNSESSGCKAVLPR
jgi:hypothetical protein